MPFTYPISALWGVGYSTPRLRSVVDYTGEYNRVGFPVTYVDTHPLLHYSFPDEPIAGCYAASPAACSIRLPKYGVPILEQE